MDARQTLIDELRAHALILGEVVLTSGRTAQYYVDAKRATLRPAGFRALGELVAARRRARLGRDRGGRADHGRGPRRLRRAGRRLRRQGVLRAQGDQAARAAAAHRGARSWTPGERCCIVEDVVTTGGSTLQAIEAVREAGLEIVGVISVLDRLAGGAERIAEAAAARPTCALATIDDVHPERDDR